MQRTVGDGVRAIREATELARSIRVELSDEYLRLIAMVEAMPQNQSGSDKGSRWRGRQDREIHRGRFLPRRP